LRRLRVSGRQMPRSGSFVSRDCSFPNDCTGDRPKERSSGAHWTDSRVAEVLHNPRYAGAYCYGRRMQHRRGIDGRRWMESLPRERWCVLIPNAHDGYISWDQYESNLKQLQENERDRGKHRKYPPREGPALLQDWLCAAFAARTCRCATTWREGGESALSMPRARQYAIPGPLPEHSRREHRPRRQRVCCWM